jgi:mono/diheme cytochrome c family protein
MNFPPWNVPLLGGGLLIAVVAILHVFVAHFAVGGGLFLVWSEARAYRRNDQALLQYVRAHSTFFVLLVLVFGAVSGVGIWWTIGLVSPWATSALIHSFVWAWAIEWVFFFVEIAAAFVYYYGWDRLDRRTHLAVGWVYFGAGWLSLFVINGILTFMLTPGRWLMTRTLADGFFNPTMLPSLVVRTGSAIALAGLYALLTATSARMPDEASRQRMTRYAASWLLAGASVLPLAGAWYVSRIPEAARLLTVGGSPAVTIFAAMSIGLSLLIVLATYFAPYRRPALANIAVAALIAVVGLGVTGATEWVREAVRKPYVIYNYMYSNGVLQQDRARISDAGILQVAKWVDREAIANTRIRVAEEVFRVECRSCHTVDGYNGVRPLLEGWSEPFIDYQLQRLNELKGYMPPFIGNEAERRALAHWLAEVGRMPPFSTVPAQPGAIAGPAARIPGGIGDQGPGGALPRSTVPDPRTIPSMQEVPR